jgi:hypothetical protein
MPSTASLQSVSNQTWFEMNSFASLYNVAFDILIPSALLVGSSIENDEGYIGCRVVMEVIEYYLLHHLLKDINLGNIIPVFP